MGTNRTGPTEAATAAMQLGNSAYGRLYSCTTGSRRPKRVRLAPAIREILIRNCFVFQSLNWSRIANNYRTNGSMDLRSKYLDGSTLSYPKVMNYPVFVFRLSSPGSGYQYSYATNNHRKGAPLVCYQLCSVQNFANDALRYYWWNDDTSAYGGNCPINIANNVGDALLPETGSTKNQAGGVDVEQIFKNNQKYCHESSDIQVLFTAPKSAPMDIQVQVVTFDKDYAPPDIYRDYTEVPTVLREINEGLNSGNNADSHTFADRVTNWLAGRMSHPCYQPIYQRGVTTKQFWYPKHSFTKTLTPAMNTSFDQNAVQYLHRHLHRPNRWYNCNVEPERNPVTNGCPNEVSMNPQTIQDQSGMFTKPEQTEWLMVSGFTRNVVGAEISEPSLTLDGSFDISIRSWFSASADGV